MKPAFLLTIDTEGDNLWARPSRITTENSRWLPRFQTTCERHGFVPTYLTNYEMALCPVFSVFARGVIERRAGEVGMHLHAWNSPPIRPLTDDDMTHHPFLIEYPVDVIYDKICALTRILQDTFRLQVASHRAGRWAFNGAYAKALIENGYLVDCSVTPGLRWASGSGAGGVNETVDYTDCAARPYFVDIDDVRRPGHTALLELPMTIQPASPWAIESLRRVFILGRAVNHFFPRLVWLRPNGRNRGRMLALLDRAVQQGAAYVEFMLHSSELMPGGSPAFPNSESIEALYRDLDAVFSYAAARFQPSTLSGFARRIGPEIQAAERR